MIHQGTGESGMDHDQQSKSATVVHTIKRPKRAPVSSLGDAHGKTVSVVEEAGRAEVQAVENEQTNTGETPARPIDQQLQRKLLTAVSGSEKKPVAIELIVTTLCEVLSPALVTFIDRDNAQSLRAPSDPDVIEQLPPGAADQLRQWANETCEAGSTGFYQLAGANKWTVVTVPVILRGRPPEVVCAIFRDGTADQGRVGSTLQLGASHITLWYILQEARQAKAESQNTSALLELLAQLDNSEDLASACYVLVNDLRSYLRCGRIVLGLTKSGKLDCKLAAVSGLSDFDQRSDFSERIESVLNEALLRDQITVVGTEKKHNDEGTRAHLDLQRSCKAGTLISAPLHSGQGEVVGAWLFVDEKPVPENSETLHFVRASQVVVGSRLWMLQRAELHPLTRAFRAASKFAGTKRFVICCIGAMLVSAAMMIPVNYKVNCDCQLEPVSRRYVAAPYDGSLEEALVQAGQFVSKGQVLARMDARELRWQLSGLNADFQSEKKKRDAASARDEFALSQQSDLEMQRISLQMQLIQHRLDNLEIKSPIDGVVIEGDLKKSEGAPLTIGQTMFEIGPLDQMIVEVAIPERDILYVKEDMPVKIRFDASQHATEKGTIKRISPRSEIRGDESVFVADVMLDNRQLLLRPGMKGSAKVVSDPHPLGWNLFHKAWESLAMLIGC